jgi:class 3 adenylate cyclase
MVAALTLVATPTAHAQTLDAYGGGTRESEVDRSIAQHFLHCPGRQHRVVAKQLLLVRVIAEDIDRGRELIAGGIRIRAGVHIGECERRGQEWSGLTIHTGARIGAMAGAG